MGELCKHSERATLASSREKAAVGIRRGSEFGEAKLNRSRIYVDGVDYGLELMVPRAA
jgi:hypothetical protein